MSEKEFLIALGNLHSIAIDNTKNSKAVEIYVNDIRRYVQQKENIIKEVREILKEGLEQFDTRRREEIYAEQYFENSLEILDKEKE